MRIGMVGYKFMGKAHSHAYRTAPYFFDIKGPVELAAVCGRDEAAVAAFAEKHGWQSYETNWRKLIERADIDVIDIGTPNDSHYEIAVAAAQVGKHILLEKPMAISLAEAREMYAEARRAGIKHQIGFNYRRVPAIALARQLIDEGKIGKVFHFNAVYYQDWLVDPEFPYVWRHDKQVAIWADVHLSTYVTNTGDDFLGGFCSLQNTFIK